MILGCTSHLYISSRAYYSLSRIGSQKWKIIYKVLKRSLMSSRQENPVSSKQSLRSLWVIADIFINTFQGAIARHRKPHVPEHQYRYSSAKRRYHCTLITHRKVEYRGWQSFNHIITCPRTGSCATSVRRDTARRKHNRRSAER
jgi:hypothetical protein